uniref:Rab-GAP TBC domain-containing protein n=1 Tax=Taenia asiatica TaxID=60517 RepID=A0A158R8D1_TAEAS
LAMALIQAQIVITKSNEIEMLKNVHQRVTNWVKNSPSFLQRQCEDRVISLLKTGLHLIEDVPSGASYAAFKQLAEYLSDDADDTFDIYQMKTVDEDEKMSLIKKLLSLVYYGDMYGNVTPRRNEKNSFRRKYSSGTRTFVEGSDIGDYSSPPYKHQDSAFSNRDTNLLEEVGPKPVVKSNARAQKEDNLSARRRSFDQLDRKSVAVEPNAHVIFSFKEPDFFGVPVTKNARMCDSLQCLGEGLERTTLVKMITIIAAFTFSSSRGRYPNQFQQESSTIPRVPLRNEENTSKEETSTLHFSDYDYVSIPNHTLHSSSTIGHQAFTASDRFEFEGNHVSSRSSSSDRERVSHPLANDSKTLGCPQVPSVGIDEYLMKAVDRASSPDFLTKKKTVSELRPVCISVMRNLRFKAQGPLCHGTTSTWSRVPFGDNALRRSGSPAGSMVWLLIVKTEIFFYASLTEYSQLSLQLKRTVVHYFFVVRSSSNGMKAKVVPTTPSIVPPPRDERSVSRDGSLSSISLFHPYDDNISNGNWRPLSPTAKPHRSRSPSETSDMAVVGVRERVIEIQQRSAAASPAVATKQHFPPLSLIPQLHQQKSESTVDWLDRLKGRLKQYMEPSCREYDVILRWILSCGSRHEGGYAAISLQMSVEDLVNRLAARDAINDSRGVLPPQPLRDGYFNSSKMNLYGASSGKQ